MYIVFSLFLLLFGFLNCFAQQPRSAASPLLNPSVSLMHSIEPEEGRQDVGFDILPVSEGLVITGSSSSKATSVDGLVMLVDRMGNVQWRKIFGGNGMDLIFSALRDGDGYICVGFKSPGGEVNMKSMDGWILRIDSKGSLIWEQTYGGTGEDRLTGIRSINNGWIAVGHRESNGKIEAWVLQIDRYGKEAKSWTLKSDLPTKGLDVLPLQDGGFVFVGGEGAERETSDGFAIRIDTNGNMIWKQKIGGAGFQVGYHLQPFQDGSFLVVGYGATGTNKDHDSYIMKLSADGKVVYHNNFGGPTNDRVTNALILENNGLIVAGQTQRPGAQDEDSGWDMIVYAVDPNGAPIWSGRFGGEGVEFGRAVKGSANELWILGHTTSEPGGSKVLMIRMDASSLLNH